MSRLDVRRCFYYLVIASGAAILLLWIHMNSKWSRVRNATVVPTKSDSDDSTSVDDFAVGEEMQRPNIGISVRVNKSYNAKVRKIARVHGFVVGEDQQGTNRYRSSVRNATRVNGLMVGEENKGIHYYHASVRNSAKVNKFMTGEDDQELNIYHSRVRNDAGINGFMTKEENKGINNYRSSVRNADRVNGFMDGKANKGINNYRSSVRSADRVYELMDGKANKGINNYRSSVRNADRVYEFMDGKANKGINDYHSSVRNADMVNGFMDGKANKVIKNYRSSVRNADRVNGFMVGEEKGIDTYDSSVRNEARVKEIMVGEQDQVIYSNHSGAELAGRDTNRRFVKYNHFTKMKFGPVYIFGVTIGNSTTSAHWDIIKIRGSMGNIYAKGTFYFCCMKYVDNPYYIKQSVTVVNIRHKMEKLTAPHFTCQNPRPGVVPNGVALTVNSYTCSEEHVVYRTPEVTLRQPGVKLAICTKLAYGSRNAELLIDFMEVYKYLGVDKFVTYYLKDLNEDARKVLEYYASTGILDLYYFEPADEENIKRRFGPPDDQSRSDKQLLIFDAFERMSGYTYFGIIDHDEFLFPSKNRSLKHLLADLFYKNTNAAGFTFQSKHYCTNKGRHGTINDQILGQFITTSNREPEYFAQKNIYKPIFMNPGFIHTHYPKTKNSAYELKKILAKEGYFRHYRNCNARSGTHFPLDNELINDNTVADWSRRIQHNVEEVRYHVFGSPKYVKYP